MQNKKFKPKNIVVSPNDRKEFLSYQERLQKKLIKKTKSNGK